MVKKQYKTVAVVSVVTQLSKWPNFLNFVLNLFSSSTEALNPMFSFTMPAGNFNLKGL
jgi:hypothetical protein